MAVFRVNATKDYTIMSNRHLRDKSLSLRGKGLLSVMLSLHKDWDYSIAGLSAISQEGTKAIRSILNELEVLGYLTRTRTQDEKGRFDYVYDIYETPQPRIQEPHTPEGHTVDGNAAQGTQYNNNQLNIKELSINNKESKKATFDEIINSFTEDEEERELLKEWLKVRKAKRAAMTNKAIELNLKKLRGLAKESKMPVATYLQEVICRGWQAFYVINNYQKSNKPQIENNKEEYPDAFKKYLKSCTY